MTVELTSAQCEVLLELVNEALREIGPEIHHTRTTSYKEDLRDLRHDLSSVRALLTAVEPKEEASSSEAA
jgi:hypothetical protein